jgi:phosphoglycerol transferase MdoB-like AlkP superfamily enzyme
VFGAISFGAALSSVVHLIRWKKVSLLAFEQVFLRIVTNTLILSFFSNIFLAGWALWDQGNVTNIHDKELEMVKLTLMTVGIIALIFSTIFYLKSNKKNLKSIQLNVVGLIALVVCAINLFITIWIIQPENNLQISF